MKNKLIKILSILSIVIVLASSFVISASAAEDYSDYLGYWTLLEDPNLPPSDVDVQIDGFEFVNMINGVDGIITQINITPGDGNRTFIFSGKGDYSYLAYGELRQAWFCSRTINVITCNAALANFLDLYAVKRDVNNSDDYNKGYDAGYNSGYDYGYTQGLLQGQGSGYQDGYNTGYDVGYDDGVSATDSQNLGKNLLGNTLNAPMIALNQFVLYDPPGDLPPITLGSVLGGVISLSLFIAFLKIFAGG